MINTVHLVCAINSIHQYFHLTDLIFKGQVLRNELLCKCWIGVVETGKLLDTFVNCNTVLNISLFIFIIWCQKYFPKRKFIYIVMNCISCV